MADEAMANAHAPAEVDTEEEMAFNREIDELEKILASAKKEGAKRLIQDRSRIDAIKQQELAKNRKEIEGKVFNANTADFAGMLKGPMHIRRCMEADQTDCFLVSRSSTSSPGEFVATWTKGTLSMHPWNKGTPERSYPTSTITGNGPPLRRGAQAPVWTPPPQRDTARLPYPISRHRPPSMSDTAVPVPGLSRSFGGFKRLGAGGVAPPQSSK